MSKIERANFGSKLGVILATAGSAVGLGNVWRFPYMTGENGGAVFIIIYVGCVLLLGIPCMISEFIVGRHGQSNTARAFRKLAGGRRPGIFQDVLYGDVVRPCEAGVLDGGHLRNDLPDYRTWGAQRNREGIEADDAYLVYPVADYRKRIVHVAECV